MHHENKLKIRHLSLDIKYTLSLLCKCARITYHAMAMYIYRYLLKQESFNQSNVKV